MACVWWPAGTKVKKRSSESHTQGVPSYRQRLHSYCPDRQALRDGAGQLRGGHGCALHLMMTWHRFTPHPRALRVGFWWSARLVKGAARVGACLRRGAVRADARTHDGRAVGVCALAAACVLLRRLSGRLRRLGAGWTRLVRGSIRSGKPSRIVAKRVPQVSGNGVTELLYPGRRAPRRPRGV